MLPRALRTRWVLVALHHDGRIYVPSAAPVRAWLINEREMFAGYDFFPGARLLVIPGGELHRLVTLSAHTSFALPWMDPRL